ncbi:hypothetical protein PIB30_054420 [Stylosanthes scabra]|uniref:Jacalin-type lectin domain-containing protein n=1 Tax=Stylosanthes scabra TaxID=79078 RepID=A0ABU6YG75_9FABA|nr:hypothetical protein [Stylosanthes scabra]
MAPRGRSRRAARAEPAPEPAKEAGQDAPAGEAPQAVQSLSRLNREYHVASALLLHGNNEIHLEYYRSGGSEPDAISVAPRLSIWIESDNHEIINIHSFFFGSGREYGRIECFEVTLELPFIDEFGPYLGLSGPEIHISSSETPRYVQSEMKRPISGSVLYRGTTEPEINKEGLFS